MKMLLARLLCVVVLVSNVYGITVKVKKRSKFVESAVQTDAVPGSDSAMVEAPAESETQEQAQDAEWVHVEASEAASTPEVVASPESVSSCGKDGWELIGKECVECKKAHTPDSDCACDEYVLVSDDEGVMCTKPQEKPAFEKPQATASTSKTSMVVRAQSPLATSSCHVFWQQHGKQCVFNKERFDRVVAARQEAGWAQAMQKLSFWPAELQDGAALVGDAKIKFDAKFNEPKKKELLEAAAKGFTTVPQENKQYRTVDELNCFFTCNKGFGKVVPVKK